MNAPATTIANQPSARTAGHNRTITVTTASPARQLAQFATRSRPPASAPEPAPAPRAATVKPTDPTAVVIAALLSGDNPYKSVSDIIELTGLKRGTVCSTIGALAEQGRAERVVNDQAEYLVVRWVLKR